MRLRRLWLTVCRSRPTDTQIIVDYLVTNYGVTL